MLNHYKHIHFIGIGGIGMSALATIFHNRGHYVSGCDVNLHQASIKSLSQIGCTINNHGDPSCFNDHIDLIVYSTDIKQNLAEIRYASERGIPMMHRGDLLALLMDEKQGIAIAGAHGKTTTSALISHIFVHANLDPTVVIGGIVHSLGSNARIGNGPYLIAEADESDRSFLQLRPFYTIITNIDLEHLDTYKDLNDIKETFCAFLNNIHPSGAVFVCIDDKNSTQLNALNTKNIVTYGLTPTADVTATDLVLLPMHSEFTVSITKNSKNKKQKILLPLAGNHNVQNALAAIAIAHYLDIPLDTIANALITFSGVDRRFSFRGTYNNALIFDDYGHHPTEITKTILVARQNAKKRLVVIFQPHRFSRTAALWDSFIDTFCQQKIDHLIITDIYAAGESPLSNISGALLANAINQTNPPFFVEYITLENLFKNPQQTIGAIIQPDDLLLLQGAGNIISLGTTLLL